MYRSVLFLLIFAFCQADAQSVLYLKNPSFEDVPNDSRPPKFWKDEGFEEYTPTDIHPSGSYGVTAKAADGKTYVGMVVRDDESWECIGQPLSKPLQADSCYFMAVKLMRSPEYQSMSPLKRAPANFNKPCVLRVWGGKKKGKGMKLLHETSPVDHTHWKTYELFLVPDDSYDYLYLEAYFYFGGGETLPYNGNLLLDHCSPIVLCRLAESGDDLYEY